MARCGGLLHIKALTIIADAELGVAGRLTKFDLNVLGVGVAAGIVQRFAGNPDQGVFLLRREVHLAQIELHGGQAFRLRQGAELGA